MTARYTGLSLDLVLYFYLVKSLHDVAVEQCVPCFNRIALVMIAAHSSAFGLLISNQTKSDDPTGNVTGITYLRLVILIQKFREFFYSCNTVRAVIAMLTRKPAHNFLVCQSFPSQATPA